VIVDACYSYYLAYARGPGGSRRPSAGFTALSGLATDDRVGLLLSTSSARESHEWKVSRPESSTMRSDLACMGAADSDGDGVVSYREIAAFVERANAAIANERFRPQVYARPPQGGEALLDLRSGLSRRLEIPPQAAGHYELEDGRASGLPSFTAGRASRCICFAPPAAASSSYGRRAVRRSGRAAGRRGGEPGAAHGAASARRGARRGHEAFSHLFDLPFGASVVAGYRYPAPPEALAEVPVPARRRAAPWLLGGAGALAAASAATAFAAHAQSSSLPANASNAAVAAQNDSIARLNVATAVLLGTAVVSALVGAGFLLGPAARRDPEMHDSSSAALRAVVAVMTVPFRASVAVSLLLASCASSLSEADRSCPCAAGWTCCAATNVCARDAPLLSLCAPVDSTPPAAPSLRASSPASPTNLAQVDVIGIAEAGARVELFTNAQCAGPTAGAGVVDAAEEFHIAVTLVPDATTQVWAHAIDGAGNVSACTATPLAVVQDSVPPARPALSAVTPAGPSNSVIRPELSGTAEAGSTVVLYEGAGCASELPYAGAVDVAGAFHIEARVERNTARVFAARAFDPAGNGSACSVEALRFEHDDIPPPAPDIAGTMPASPSPVLTPVLGRRLSRTQS